MPKVFQDAPAEVYNIANRMIEQFHGELHEHNVGVVITITRNFDKDENPIPALKHSGAVAAGVCRLISARTRFRLQKDAEIEICGFIWDSLSNAERDALVDHELTHLSVVVNEEGQVETHDDGRPKLKLIPDEIVITGFLQVIRRHHENALEWKNIYRALSAGAAQFGRLVQIVEGETEQVSLGIVGTQYEAPESTTSEESSPSENIDESDEAVEAPRQSSRFVRRAA